MNRLKQFRKLFRFATVLRTFSLCPRVKGDADSVCALSLTTGPTLCLRNLWLRRRANFSDIFTKSKNFAKSFMLVHKGPGREFCPNKMGSKIS